MGNPNTAKHIITDRNHIPPSNSTPVPSQIMQPKNPAHKITITKSTISPIKIAKISSITYVFLKFGAKLMF